LGNIFSLGLIGGWIAVVIITAILFRKKWRSNKEIGRKIIHIGNGPVVLFAWYLEVPQNIALTCSLVITIALFCNHQLRLIGALEDINRKSFGTVCYGISITIMLFFLWPHHAAAVSCGMLVMAFGDGFAGLIGSSFKSYSWKILNQTKSILGTSTMFLVSYMVLTIINNYSGFPLNLIQILTITTFAVLCEQIGKWGLDNITVPLIVAFSWAFFQGA